MARIRTIKPELPQSESMGKISRNARLLFILMWTLADDSGRLRGSSRMLASLLFPYDDDAPSLIGGWVDELSTEGCVDVYRADGSTYIQIAKWLNHQKIDKPSPSKIPSFSEASRILANPRGGIKDQGPIYRGPEDQEAEAEVPPPLAPDDDDPELNPPQAGQLPMRETPPLSDDPAIQVAVRLRRLGVNVQFTHPAVQDWVRDEVSVDVLEAAVRTARERLGEAAKINGNYLVPIVRDILNPPPGAMQARASPRGYQTPTEKAKDFADRLTGKTRNEQPHIIDLNEPPSGSGG